jgi:hypothetical protein
MFNPLIWGIQQQDPNTKHSLDLENTKVAISFRFWFPLMAYVNAGNQGWNTDNLKFEIINTIDGAVEALTAGTADYFMWERFMTKPLVDKGIFCDELQIAPTPWPCFVIAVM